MSAITTHVLDTSRGRPAEGVAVRLERLGARSGEELARGATDADGRLRDLLPGSAPLEPGTYRLVFETEAYFDRKGVEHFYPEVGVVFTVRDGREHFHVPLLLSPFGYSTYRGS
jgi:5-hydroxyisourate hydrolase